MKSVPKYISLFLLCFMAGFVTQAQSVEWVKSVAQDKGQECKALYPSDDGGYWLGGHTYRNQFLINNTHAMSKIQLTAFNGIGDTLWTKHYYHKYKGGDIVKILPAPAGRYVIGNYSNDTVYNVNGDFFRSKPLVMYVDNAGESIWSLDDLMPFCVEQYTRDATLMPNGDLLVIGYYTEKNALTCTKNPKIFALRISPDGIVLWNNMYDMGGEANFGRQVEVLHNGNLLISASHLFNGVMALEIEASTGNLLQSRYIAPTGVPSVGFVDSYMKLLSNGGFIVTGYYSVGQFNEPMGYIAYLDANFNKIWERSAGNTNRKVFEMPNGYFLLENYDTAAMAYMSKIHIATGDTAWSIRMGEPAIINPNGMIVFGGRYYNFYGGMTFDGQGNMMVAGTYLDKHGDIFVPPSQVRQHDFFLAKLKDVGVPLTNFCQQGPQASFAGALVADTLKLNSTSISNVTFHDTLQYQWFVGGVALSVSNQTLQQQINVSQYPQGVPVKLVITNHWGCKDSINAVVTADGVVGNRPSVETLHATSLRNAYPNPSAQNVAIGYTLPAKTQNAVLRVYELGTGRTVAERHLSALDSEAKFNVSSWATGVYAYQLYVNGAPVAVKRLLISR